MRRFRQALIPLGLLWLAPWGARAAPVAPFPSAAAARAVSLNGEVFVTPNGASARKPLNAGDALAAGDLVETLAGASARLLLADQSVIDLDASQFRIEGMTGNPDDSERQVGLGVDFGRVRASVNKKLQRKGKFELHTRSSVLSVRGTEFTAAIDKLPGDAHRERTTVTVSQGVVAVSTPPGAPKPASALLTAGSQISAVAELAANSEGGGAAPAPLRAGLTRTLRLPAARLTSILAASRVVDHTFAQTVVVGDRVHSRFRGTSTLTIVASAVATPKLTVPRARFTVPGTFLPNAQLISGTAQSLYPVAVKVGFTP